MAVLRGLVAAVIPDAFLALFFALVIPNTVLAEGFLYLKSFILITFLMAYTLGREYIPLKLHRYDWKN